MWHKDIAHADAELASKAGLAQRRAKYDSVKARQQAQLAALEQEAVVRKRPREQDDVYTAAASLASVRLPRLPLRLFGPSACPALRSALSSRSTAMGHRCSVHAAA